MKTAGRSYCRLFSRRSCGRPRSVCAGQCRRRRSQRRARKRKNRKHSKRTACPLRTGPAIPDLRRAVETLSQFASQRKVEGSQMRRSLQCPVRHVSSLQEPERESTISLHMQGAAPSSFRRSSRHRSCHFPRVQGPMTTDTDGSVRIIKS